MKLMATQLQRNKKAMKATQQVLHTVGELGMFSLLPIPTESDKATAYS